MNDSFNSYYSDLEWVDRVHQLLMEIARASLSDEPKLPENIPGRAIPLAKEAKSIQERQERTDSQPSPNSVWQRQESEWVEEVRQTLLELSRVSLSDIPRLPAHLGQQALMLAQTAQEIKNTASQKSL